MSSILRTKAIKNVTKGNTSAYYSYMEETNGSNPVIQQLDKELNDYMGFVKKKHSGLLKPGEHAPCKVSDTLFDIWNKFEPRISTRHFYKKLMEIGEFLVQQKEYATASWQCYDRYLNSFANISLEKVQSVDDLKSLFFSDGVVTENSDVTFRALMGHCICMYHFTIDQDSKLQNKISGQKLTEILRFIRLIMQLLLETDHYCWLVYNATIYVYTIARYMMQFGFSQTVLEYLIFCCISMESSVPLLGIKYLPWRSTLYAISSQCYYDCKYYDDGEAFARRALSKINELYELEAASINGATSIQALEFREATIKIGIVLFKRLVFESRRKNKGMLRPKQRLVYKDLANQPWPRTATEKLLNEMFDSSSAQFLAIEEALSDSNRRIAMPGPAVSENESELLDIILELLFAAEYLANDSAIQSNNATSTHEFSQYSSLTSSMHTSLISMAVKKQNGIPIKSFIKIIKFAFNYESWDFFRRSSHNLLAALEDTPSMLSFLESDVHIIHLLLAFDKYLGYLRKLKYIKNEAVKANIAATREREKEAHRNSENFSEGENLDKAPVTKEEKKKTKATKSSNKQEPEDANEKATESTATMNLNDHMREEDYLFQLAHKLANIVAAKIVADKCDIDIIVDLTLLLWRKCKDVFQKFQNGSQDNCKWISKFDQFSKWFAILNATHESMVYFNISTIDPAVFANCSIRLSMIYESLAILNMKKFTKDLSDDSSSHLNHHHKKSSNDIHFEKLSLHAGDVEGNLLKSKDILKKSLASISAARTAISRSDKSFLCDKTYNDHIDVTNSSFGTKTSTCLKKLEFLQGIKEKRFEYKKNVENDSVSNLIADLHVELLFIYHKVCIRLLDLKRTRADKNLDIEKEFESLLTDCKKNKLNQALLIMCRVLYLGGHNNKDDKKTGQSENSSLAERAFKFLSKLEEDDKLLYEKHCKVDSKTLVTSKIPPAPVVCLRTSQKIVVEPRNFQSVDGVQTSWYRIFAAKMTDVNMKARISDYDYQGCGEQIPANNFDQITISGLEVNEKYVIAVAAYDKNGKLIGDSIGESTDPILASNKLSVLMGWAYLCQTSYQIGDYQLSLVSFNKLWNHFIIPPAVVESDRIVYKNEIDYEVQFHQLNFNTIQNTSPILLRKFLESIFIATDVAINQKHLYCDLIVDGKLPYFKQLERVRECEKLLVAMDLAAWLNDVHLILQAIVQCYGLLSPLIYYNLAYQPIVQILMHCLTIIEDVPLGGFQKKSKTIVESLQHMIACMTYYLTDMLKRYNRKSLSLQFNVMGRKLLGIEDVNDGADDFDHSHGDSEAHRKSKLEPGGNAQPKFSDINSKNSTNKPQELKALDLFQAKTNANPKNSFYNMLTGNEDIGQIYTFISFNSTKIIFKELIKFRRRVNYFEYLTNFLHKALTEENNSSEINSWCMDTIEWLKRRNTTILGVQATVTHKQDGVIAVAGNEPALQKQELEHDTNRTNNENMDSMNMNSNSDNLAEASIIKKDHNRLPKKRKIKRYKLLIPIDLEPSEKVKVEERQKQAIDVIFDLFPMRYENWVRRKKLRRIFNEESAHKSQFFAVWALNNFSILVNRLQQNSPQGRTNFVGKYNSSDNLDPQLFFFDRAKILLLPIEDQGDDNLKNEKTNQSSYNSNLMSLRSRKAVAKLNKLTHMTDDSRIIKNTQQDGDLNSSLTDENNQTRDTSEIIAMMLAGADFAEQKDDFKSISFIGDLAVTQESSSNNYKQSVNSISAMEYTELANRVFDKFKHASVIALRGKQWTQLQNVSKQMFNCINFLLLNTAATATETKTQYTVSDLWKCLSPYVYIVAENLLEMLFVTCPVDKNAKSLAGELNKWYNTANVGKSGAGLKFDRPLDDISAIDLRFVKDFVYRSIQCLSATEKWEKMLYIAMRFNAMTSYKYGEDLGPIIAFGQQSIKERLAKSSAASSRAVVRQKHFDYLKSQLGYYPRIEDLFFVNFKIQIDPSSVKPIELGVKIDPKVHNIYKNDNKAKELISVPLDVEQTMENLKKSLEDSFYPSRALMHSRKLLSIYLISNSSNQEFFGFTKPTEAEDNDPTAPSKSLQLTSSIPNTVSKSFKSTEKFQSNPSDPAKKTFENKLDVYVNNLNVDIKVLIESYVKAIELLVSHKEKDLAAQAMHELGNVYHCSSDLAMAYRYWNEALDTITDCKNSLINWRKEFFNKEYYDNVDTYKVVEKCGIWGCLLGGVLTSKMAQYYLVGDLDLRTESCLFSAVFFKSIFRSTIPYSKFDIDFAKDDVLDSNNVDRILPGILFNSDAYRFNTNYVIASLNYLCLELLNAGHYLTALPAVTLYEYYARSLARDLTHTVFSRLIKTELLVKQNLFNEAIKMIKSLYRYERMPHHVDERTIATSPPSKYIEYEWMPSKPVYDLNNLKCLETVLSMKLSKNLIKLFGAQLSCRFQLVLCKLYIQVAKCLPCLPNFDEFNASILYVYHDMNNGRSDSLLTELNLPKQTTIGGTTFTSKKNQADNPDVIRVFTKSTNPLTLETIKGCLLGTSKTVLLKCMKLINEDFPNIQKYCVTKYWQSEFKYECNMLLAFIADQSQLDYVALQHVADAMKEIGQEETIVDESVKSSDKGSTMPSRETVFPKRVKISNESKQARVAKRGVYEVLDLISRSHLGIRLWIRARVHLVQFMFNQLNNAGKAKSDDSTILKDFGDLKIYLASSIKEAEEYFDNESKAFFTYVDSSLELLRGTSVESCLERINLAYAIISNYAQLSSEGMESFLRISILRNDLQHSVSLLAIQKSPKNLKTANSDDIIRAVFNENINFLLGLQDRILQNLKACGGEMIECYKDPKIAYFNNVVPDLKNLFSPLLYYLVHIKLRLGSNLMLLASMIEDDSSAQLWQHSLNVMAIGLELNKVISERSLSLEIELNYKYSRCLRELVFLKKCGTLADVVDAYSVTINLAQNSYCDLSVIRNCYLELAVAFINQYDDKIMSTSQASSTNVITPSTGTSSLTSISKSLASMASKDQLSTASSNQKATTRTKKITTQMLKAIEGALTALAHGIRVSNSQRERMLLTGHKSLKKLNSINAKKIPNFVASDMLGCFVLAEKKRVFKNKIEEEILSLAPDFEPKKPMTTYDENVKALLAESDKTITWIHLLNYQSKLFNINSMKNLNTLRNGKNRNKYSEFFTTGFTPLIKNSHVTAGRLNSLNRYLNQNLIIYKNECQAPVQITEFLKLLSKKSMFVTSTKIVLVKNMLDYAKQFTGNLSTNLSQSNPSVSDQASATASNSSLTRDWSYLQLWPSNYNHIEAVQNQSPTLKINDNVSCDTYVEYTMTFSWYKDLNVSYANSVETHDKLAAIIAIKDTSTMNKIKIKHLDAEKVHEVHSKLAPLASIADTALKVQNESEVNSEFLNSLKYCLHLIADLFNKPGQEEIPFEVKASNIIDLERMFNMNFGGYTNDESLRNYISNLF